MKTVEKRTVVKTLLMLSKTLPFKKPEDVDEDVVAVWMAICRTQDVTEEEWKAGIIRLVTFAQRFPTPADMLDCVLTIREERRQAERADYLLTSKLCLDEAGHFCLAPPEKVLDGRLVDDGGNGVEYLAPSTDPDALSGGARALLGRVLDEGENHE